ncbi:hypothetical protein ACOI1H_23000 [Loktanella sp. DJP18]|uniref:hypothetical protein n=1 Tax=Loktanella sp. DJP18 TaxID=3409788 RepID=UPI003BB52246
MNDDTKSMKFRSHPMHGLPQIGKGLVTAPGFPTTGLKVSPVSLRCLTPGILSSHARLALIAEQAAIEAARVDC